MASLQLLFVGIAGILAILYSGKASWLSKTLFYLYYGKTGCMPLPDLSNVTLHYFPVRGRGEAIRLLLTEAQISYTEYNFKDVQWSKAKQKGVKNGQYLFGQVPYLESPSSGVGLSQSHAIMHYLGRTTGMDCDCDMMHMCEILAQGTEDLRAKLAEVLHNPDFSLKLREQYLNETLPVWLGYFEKLAPPLSKLNEAFFVNDRLTWVDFLLFDQLDSNMEFGRFEEYPDAMSVHVLKDFPKLRKYYNQMAARPRIAAFLNDTKRFKFALPRRPKDA
ncbi:glutathione S-transferase [Lingula anatina]|uniref:Glutathione S-transferase n=1 Tax=Lingula anatina TaxID=7574 RepID=A0A1S3H5N9_LINAN|nr:glutathione S-transferase [Lingula anatina]|eukprot:XP_013381282.1 glutathione S-transferase [Lingula anatina]